MGARAVLAAEVRGAAQAVRGAWYVVACGAPPACGVP